MMNVIILGFKIDFEKIKINGDDFLQVSMSFCITEDNLFLVVDFKGGDVKIYNSNGALLKVLGRKGFGPNEFAQPLFCHYSDRKFIISDVGQRKIFIYDRKNELKFVRTKEIFSNDVGQCLNLDNNKLYISGTKRTIDGKNYQFYYMELDTDDQYVYLLPGYMKYGLNSDKEYYKEIFNKPYISAIAALSYFDILNDFAYYIWGGDLKIFKINLNTKTISTFGKKTANYIKPSASKRLINSSGIHSTQAAKIRSQERNKMSYVRQIFASKKHVLVIYEARDNNHNDLGYMMQFYTLDGHFVKEM
jgi:hypothetical protein